ncbi:MAG: type II secretion system F family protein [Actinomycetia bacterium]|nr:type II secretion system F family protein [Actinomycetes bacterium]
MISAPVVLAGACVGAGITLVVRSLVQPAPDLRSALEHIDGVGQTLPVSRDKTLPGQLGQVAARTAPRIVESLGLRRFHADLELVGETPETFAMRKVGYALLGLAFPVLMVILMAAMGVLPPLVIPLVASLALATVLFFVPDVDLHRRAATARDELRRVVCAYLELVALERAGDAGTVEALERAATVGNSPGFVLIRDALTGAELAGKPPWQGLSELADDVGVPELGDIADIMRISGEDGAAVYATLRARAASLRTQLLTASAAQANAASEHMIVPVALLGIAFMALIGYPAFARILFG